MAGRGNKNSGSARRPRKEKDEKAWQKKQKKKLCQFCKDKVDHVDYKDVSMLRKYVSERGKIRSRRGSWLCHYPNLRTGPLCFSIPAPPRLQGLF